MGRKILQYFISFLKHLYTFVILLASDPFDIAERWFKMTYSPPFWLFWLLLVVSSSIAIWLTIRDIRRKEKENPIIHIPDGLNKITKYLKRKSVYTIPRYYSNKRIQQLSSVVQRCANIYGYTKTLPMPKKLPITQRYRVSIWKHVPEKYTNISFDPYQNWESNAKVGGILDKSGWGLNLDNDKKYQILESRVNDITTLYIGNRSKELNEQKNTYLELAYSTYSFILFVGYWEILADLMKQYGIGDATNPEMEGIIALKQKAANKYLSNELEKVKLIINEILNTR